MTKDEAIQYIGIRYVEGGESLDGFNCWGFLRFILAKHFNKTLPAVPIGDAHRTREIHENALQCGLYQPVGKPEHGDAALLRGGESPHVGIYLDFDGGGILHSLEGVGVVWTPIKQLRMLGFSRIIYYKVN